MTIPGIFVDHAATGRAIAVAVANVATATALPVVTVRVTSQAGDTPSEQAARGQTPDGLGDLMSHWQAQPEAAAARVAVDGFWAAARTSASICSR